MNNENGQMFGNQSTLSSIEMTQTVLGVGQVVAIVENSLKQQVREHATSVGISIGECFVTWTCHVTAREIVSPTDDQ